MTQLASVQRPRLASNRRRRALISLTPLIDVVFILLVFFMLASSFLDWRAIDLSAPAEATSGSSMEGALLIEIREDGLRLSGQSLDLEDLAAQIQARVADNPEQRVLVRPAEGVTLQQAVEVLDRVAKTGVAELSLVRSGGG